MKTFIFIFALYLMFLAVQPCEDMLSVSAIQDSKSEISAQCEQPEECPAQEHECSPLCICSCRQVSDFQKVETACSDTKSNIGRKTFVKSVFQNDYSHQFLDSIWQPPKNRFNV